MIMLLIKKEAFKKSNMGCRSPLYAESLLAARVQAPEVIIHTPLMMRPRTPEKMQHQHVAKGGGKLSFT